MLSSKTACLDIVLKKKLDLLLEGKVGGGNHREASVTKPGGTETI